MNKQLLKHVTAGPDEAATVEMIKVLRDTHWL